MFYSARYSLDFIFLESLHFVSKCLFFLSSSVDAVWVSQPWLLALLMLHTHTLVLQSVFVVVTLESFKFLNLISQFGLNSGSLFQKKSTFVLLLNPKQ